MQLYTNCFIQLIFKLVETRKERDIYNYIVFFSKIITYNDTQFFQIDLNCCLMFLSA